MVPTTLLQQKKMSVLRVAECVLQVAVDEKKEEPENFNPLPAHVGIILFELTQKDFFL